jgi:hypothetical protein
MTPSTPVQDLAAQWKSARHLYPIYLELAREFTIEVKPCADLEAGAATPEKEKVEQAQRWLDELDQLIQVHQLRQFLQSSSLVKQEGLVCLLQHFLAKPVKTDVIRDKIDFLLVQYFSQLAPTGVKDEEVDLAYVAQALETVLGEVELKPPVWLNAVDRALESARRSHSLDELLHGGVLEQGRKAKALAGDLFYLPVALAAFTRFGYLIRRTFFRLMLGDLNTILDGLTELEDKGVATIDCRRAQFSAQEPIVRLRIICQSWKVMFQAEYSSGQPLRMLVDLRASVDQALGRGKTSAPDLQAQGEVQTGPASGPNSAHAPQAATLAAEPMAAAAAAGAVTPSASAPSSSKPGGEQAVSSDPPEFEVSTAPGWDPESGPTGDKI